MHPGKEEKREATSVFLPPSQAPLRASNCLFIFFCEKKKVATGYDSVPSPKNASFEHAKFCETYDEKNREKGWNKIVVEKYTS